MNLSLRPSRVDDAEWIAELRAVVLRDDLERLGRFDPVRVRERFLTAFNVTLTRIIVVGGADVGSIAVRPAEDGTWIEHFYLDAALQGQGIGSGVLGSVLAEQSHFRLNVLQGSRARHLYERHGFELDYEDEVDVFMHRPG
ncbi:GNAT family N-acetyltransferase [Microbacterium murale]|uniref:GNAT superfamily N-acetyltransferase n=1 Tax=Microbacterium murale TaxID=1081040 RepID=A0ABU0P599_9MICO|nr:GNAT family N-acetyltransferase [Microbacterium murale]MDQ0642490.1 GNAT superfamily N-acetyltransferase [Microbacterium murale]